MNKFQQVDGVAELLRSAGPREDAPSERARRVELVVRGEWHDVVRQRNWRKRARQLAGSGLAAAALITLCFQAAQKPAGVRVASTPPAAYGSPGFGRTTAGLQADSTEERPAPAEVPAEDVVPGFSRARVTARATHRNPAAASARDERVPESAVLRPVLVNYSWETR